MHEMWHYILNTYAPNCEYVYNAEEWGPDLWETNDIDGTRLHIGNYCIDYMGGDKTLRNKLNLDEGANYFTKKGSKRIG